MVEGENRHVGGSQGRKPDDERHRLRRGREKLGTNFIVTESFIYKIKKTNKVRRCPFTPTIKKRSV